MEEGIKQLRDILDQSRRIAVLSGAGMSTESGIPDFRSEKRIVERSPCGCDDD